MLEKISLAQKFSLFNDHWQPRIVGEVNGTQIKIVKLLGEFDWHHHDMEDEMFLVVGGTLDIELEDGVVNLSEGEMVVIPRGTEHRPVARKEAMVMLVEPGSTINTGNKMNDKTTQARWI